MGPRSNSAREALNNLSWFVMLGTVLVCCIGRARDRSEAAKADMPQHPSQKARVAAARVRVRLDRHVARSTPRWIIDLAQGGRAQ